LGRAAGRTGSMNHSASTRWSARTRATAGTPTP
jgi:hypothetical protein